MTMPPGDQQYIRTLSILYYVFGGIQAVGASLPVIHLIFGIAFVASDMGPQGPPPFFGWIFVVIGAAAILIGWPIAILALLAGGRLRRWQSYNLCFAAAVAACIVVPLGTALGVLTLIELSKPEVKAAFDRPLRPGA
jgi:hypothetical protein